MGLSTEEKIAKTKANNHRYFATDKNGDCWSFKNKPYIKLNAWINTGKLVDAAQLECNDDISNMDWTQSLTDITSSFNLNDVTIEVHDDNMIVTSNIFSNGFKWKIESVYDKFQVYSAVHDSPWSIVGPADTFLVALNTCHNIEQRKFIPFPLKSIDLFASFMCHHFYNEHCTTACDLVDCHKCILFDDNREELPLELKSLITTGKDL